MLFSAVSVLVVAQSSSEIPEGLMNNPVYIALLYSPSRSLSYVKVQTGFCPLAPQVIAIVMNAF